MKHMLENLAQHKDRAVQTLTLEGGSSSSITGENVLVGGGCGLDAGECHLQQGCLGALQVAYTAGLTPTHR